MTHTHEFPSSEDVGDNICDDDTIEDVRYIGSRDVVTCSKEEVGGGYSRKELEAMSRSEVYDVAKEVEADPDWSGDDADTKETMIVKILEEQEV